MTASCKAAGKSNIGGKRDRGKFISKDIPNCFSQKKFEAGKVSTNKVFPTLSVVHNIFKMEEKKANVRKQTKTSNK